MSEPRIRVMPEYSRTSGKAAVEFMAEHGAIADGWQADILDDWLAIENGKYVATTCGLSCPRQNGKTFLIKARCEVGALNGETIICTAHEVKTARQLFEQIAGDFDKQAGFPDLAETTEYIRRANGQEEVKLLDWQDENGVWHDGGRIIFSARSRGAARGFTADVVIFDEAQELTSQQVSAILPTTSAGRKKRPQAIMCGTPPEPGSVADVFANLRRDAMEGLPDIAWHEWSVEKRISKRDNAAIWKAVEDTNPAFGVRLMRDAVKAELSVMGEDYFARERLGWWGDEAQRTDKPIDQRAWESCQGQPASGLLVMAVKFDPVNRIGTVCAATKSKDGYVVVEHIETEPASHGWGWLVDMLTRHSSECAAIVIDGGGDAQDVNERLLKAGVDRRKIIRPRAYDMTKACSMFANAVREGGIVHLGQDSLTSSAIGSTKRRIGTGGGWGFASNENADSTPIEACALAYWQAVTTKVNPARKMRIG